MDETSVSVRKNNNPPLLGGPELKKKKSHDIAYLLIILAILFATFLFAMVIVNSMLHNIG